MKRSWLFLVILLAFALVGAASADNVKYYGGFEDRAGATSDYDYNDLVFTISGNGLQLVVVTTDPWNGTPYSGVWSPKPVLNGAPYPSKGTPFWNNGSLDGSDLNVGFCIYGGGSCGAGLDPTALYLATPTGGSVPFVFVTPTNGVTEDITIEITADPNDRLGWYDSLGNSALFPSATGKFSFSPAGGMFGLIGQSSTATFYSGTNAAGGETVVSHFAMFEPVPEPMSLLLLGSGLLGMVPVLRRRFKA